MNNKIKNALNFHKSGNLNKALALYEEILQKAPNNDMILYYSGLIYKEQNNPEKSIKNIEKAVSINPESSYTVDLADLYYDEKKYKEASEYYIKTLQKTGDNPGVSFNLGLCFYKLNKFNDAINIFLELLKTHPSDPEVLYNLALSYREILDFKKAIECVEKALKINPGYGDAQFLAACILLQNKNFNQGWKYYESRFIKKDKVERIKLNKPLWDGSSLEGKTLYVYHEQGYGDSVMFARFLPELSKICKKVIFKPQSGLETLFRENSDNLKAEIIDNDTPNDDVEFDSYIQLMSLPMLLKINETNIPLRDKYLEANPDKVDFYKQEYFNNQSLKIGLAWQSNKNLEDQRPIPLELLCKLAELNNVKLYSLQKNYGSEQLDSLPEGVEITDLGVTFNDFSDTTAAIENLDIVITIDTSIAHLAGAMGKKTFVLLPYAADWKWMINREDCIWYDSVKLFRQPQIGDWQGVVDKVYNDLESMIF